MPHPLNKFLPARERKRLINRATTGGSHPSMVNPKAVSPPDYTSRWDPDNHPGFDGLDVQMVPVNPLWSRFKSGTILNFLYNGSDSYGRSNKDNNPFVIYINYGYERVCSTANKRNINNGDQFFTGISVKYVELELAVALSRIISSKGSFLNYDVVRSIDKHVAYSAYRMYYTKNVVPGSLFKADITQLEY